MLWPRRDIAHYDDEKLEHRFYFLESFWKAADMDRGECMGLVGAWGLLEHCIFLFQLIMILQKNTICTKVITIRIHYIVSKLDRPTLAE